MSAPGPTQYYLFTDGNRDLDPQRPDNDTYAHPPDISEGRCAVRLRRPCPDAAVSYVVTVAGRRETATSGNLSTLRSCDAELRWHSLVPEQLPAEFCFVLRQQRLRCSGMARFCYYTKPSTSTKSLLSDIRINIASES